MMQLALRRAVMAARSASREVIKPIPAMPNLEPPPPPPPPPPQRDWLVVVRQEQHDDHVLAYWWSQFAKLAPAPARFENIRRAVCIQFGVSKLEILSHRRSQRIARARMACMYLAKSFTSYSFPEIGRRAGGFDHSTVIHAVARIASLRATDPELDAAIGAVERFFQQGEAANV